MEIIKCTTKDQLIDHYIIRKEVFILEQNVSFEDEFDLEEKTRIPFVVYLDEKAIATARINIIDEIAIFERICVLKKYRDKKIGSTLLSHLIDYSKQMNIKEVIIGSQEQAMKFYEKLGFKKYGSLYYDANIPHYKMKKNL